MTNFLIKHYWHSPGMTTMNRSKAPKLSNSAGSMIALLDAVLVNGFGSATVSMAIHPNDVTKAIITEPSHEYSLTARIKVDGCDNPAFNTEYEIIEIPDANTYVVDVTGLHSQAAGTPVTTSSAITVKIPSLGWTKEFSGTNKAVYRMKGGNRRYLWVDDTDTSAGITRVRGAWGATGPEFANLISTFPDVEQTAAGSDPRWHHYINSSKTGPWGTTSDIAWTIIGTDRFFYLSVQHYYGQNTIANRNSSRAIYVFGDANPYNPNDTSATILAAGYNNYAATSYIYNVCTFGEWQEGYDYRQTFAGTWWNIQKPTFYRMIPPFADSVSWSKSVGLGRGVRPFNPFNDVLIIGAPVLLSDDATSSIRSEMPGMAVSPNYINEAYPQNSIINVNGIRYMIMSTRYQDTDNSDGCFLVQIDGDMHTLKGTL